MAAAIFTGIAFRFRQGERTHVFMVWYFVAGSEAVASLLLSNVSPILNLAETHLMKRLILMTVMIMGNGVSEVAKKVVIIVKNSHAWGKTLPHERHVPKPSLTQAQMPPPSARS